MGQSRQRPSRRGAFRPSRAGWHRLLLSAVGLCAIGGASGTVMAHYTLSGMNPFYANGGASADYDPGRLVGLDRDDVGDPDYDYSAQLAEIAYQPDLPSGTSLSLLPQSPRPY